MAGEAAIQALAHYCFHAKNILTHTNEMRKCFWHNKFIFFLENSQEMCYTIYRKSARFFNILWITMLKKFGDFP